MAEEFDPYSQLLGIPAIDSAGGGPNHYRLLGVTLFEPERATIDAAARRLMAQLQRNAGGADPAAIRRLLGEISNARVCLLTPEKRAAYDERLRTELDAAEVHDVIVEAIDEPELTGSGVGHGGDTREAGAGQGSGAARPATPSKSARPAASGGQGGGGFFADLGIGSGIGSAARGSANTKPSAAQSPATGMNFNRPTANKSASGKPAAGKSAASGASAAAWSGGAPGKGKNASGAAAKSGSGTKQGWKPQPWQIAAAVGGVVLLVVVVIFAMNSGDDDNRQANVNHAPPPPKFGPSSVTGPIDDVTTRSPLGSRPSTRITTERHGDLLLANVKINGADAGKFLLDTGCADVVISTALAEQLKLAAVGQSSVQSPGGKRPATKRRITSLTLGDAKFEDSNMLPERKDNWNILATDMKPWQDAVGVPIAGVIGCDIWYQMPVQWDVTGNNVTLYNRHQNVVQQSGNAQFMTLINAAASVGQPCASASLDHAKEVDYWLLATGAPTDLLVKTGKGGAASEKVGTLTVFGKDFANPTSAELTADSAYFADDARQRGVIGSHILANFVLVLDFQNNKYLAQRNGAK